MLTFNPKLICCALLISVAGYSQEIVKQPVQSYQTKEYQTKKTGFVNSLLSKMTLDEKLGQLNLPGAGDITTGQAQSSDIGKKIKKEKLVVFLI